MEFDSVQIGAQDIAAVAESYKVLLGSAPRRTVPGPMRFQLHRGAVEIEAGAAGLHSMRFTVATDFPRAPADSFHGLRVAVTRPTPTSAPVRAAGVEVALDHVVINTPDADRAVALWRDQLGLRLALDRAFPQRGLRLVFFRSAGVTLEFAAPLPPPAERSGADALYGLAYRVGDLNAYRTRLLEAGVDVSEPRAGQKRGTTVATVRSGTAGVPTLLIHDPSRDA